MKISITELHNLIVSKLSPPYTPEEAEKMSDVILYGELSGRKSHGLLRLLRGSAGVFVRGERGKINIENRSKISSIVHGRNNPGLLVGPVALDETIRIATEHDIAVVGTKGSVHTTGAVSYYCQQLAEAGFISIIFTQSSPFVAPFGVINPLFGTNPISFGIPHKDQPLIFDMSTAAIAYGDIKKAQQQGKDLPKGVAINASGSPTQNPDEAIEGAILPFDGGYKGSALAMIVEIFGSVLPGGSFMGLHKDDGWGNTFIAFSPDLLSDKKSFEKRMEEFLSHLGGAKSQGQTIRLPGMKTQEQYRKALQAGWIEIDEDVYKQIQKITH